MLNNTQGTNKCNLWTYARENRNGINILTSPVVYDNVTGKYSDRINKTTSNGNLGRTKFRHKKCPPKYVFSYLPLVFFFFWPCRFVVSTILFLNSELMQRTSRLYFHFTTHTPSFVYFPTDSPDLRFFYYFFWVIFPITT